jgi:hypothetical protein
MMLFQLKPVPDGPRARYRAEHSLWTDGLRPAWFCVEKRACEYEQRGSKRHFSRSFPPSSVQPDVKDLRLCGCRRVRSGYR